ncbi:MAG TPA: hypothetical protein VGZ02_09255 [Candidatus Baltobacteraceae bacterium]|jgi:hypothetical protein|nr:hypothetical protein [Candidatus Baltobacteraceae bacterium]
MTVQQALGDRMFTTITAAYDAKTQALAYLKREANCCGSYWFSSVTRNADGTYDIEAQMTSGQGVYKESRSHFNGGTALINAGDFFIVPWMYHVTHIAQIVELSFSPIRTDLIRPEETAAAPFPEGVPSHDGALLLRGVDNKPMGTLWYDPCTFTLDAYKLGAGTVWVRTADL